MRILYEYHNIKLFIQGSYANNTNVKTHSDVDIAAVQEEIFKTIYHPGVTDKEYNFSSAPNRTTTFKDEVEDCLISKFGSDVEQINKSIKINGNSYRKDAYSVPGLRFRDYRQDYHNNTENYIGGIIIKPDDVRHIKLHLQLQ